LEAQITALRSEFEAAQEEVNTPHPARRIAGEGSAENRAENGTPPKD